MTGFAVHRDEASVSFFDAAAGGALAIRHCQACSVHHQVHTRYCPEGHELEWVAASGSGTLASWAIDHGRALDPVLALPDGSSAFGIVELDEGPWLYAPLVDVDATSLMVGLRMSVRFVRPGDGETIPAFTRAP